jgi:hypothetical protein
MCGRRPRHVGSSRRGGPDLLPAVHSAPAGDGNLSGGTVFARSEDSTGRQQSAVYEELPGPKPAGHLRKRGRLVPNEWRIATSPRSIPVRRGTRLLHMPKNATPWCNRLGRSGAAGGRPRATPFPPSLEGQFGRDLRVVDSYTPGHSALTPPRKGQYDGLLTPRYRRESMQESSGIATLRRSACLQKSSAVSWRRSRWPSR